MAKTEKHFDCVEMMHEGALRIYNETRGMSREEELAYWRRKDEEARKKPPRLCSVADANAPAGKPHR